ncbi:MAG: hypothetical protein M1813_001751 [Trichoglossum hirsutum]|nr:MAG: hypothetical protein M1813_001751 [Trichoglossum hirsutum]
MTDPLSIAAGIAGLISLGIQVTGSLVKFYTSHKGQDADVTRTTEKLDSLLNTFRFLDSALQSRTFRPDEQDLIKNIESSIHKCDDLIQELKEEYEKFDKASTSGIKSTIKVTGRRAVYPFRQSTLQKLDEDISEIRDNLSLALDVLQLRDNQRAQDDITELKLLLKLVRASQISSTICDWLKAPDATINHNAACAKRHPGTGTWFVKGPHFTTWLTQDNSFLWLNGFAGCGKSVLCSTAIQHTFRRKRSDPGVGIAFFYFTFNDESKQDESAMLRALLLQLSGQLSDSQTDLARLRDSYNTGTPPATVLIAYLRHLIQKFDQVYILLDALDECPQYDQRDQVLIAIDTMRKWLFPGLHLLVTSRDEPDIRESLNSAGNEEVIMKNAEINRDISDFISGQLNINPKLRRWSAHHGRIQQVLSEQAQGVFRWVECQFKSLMGCPRSESHLEQCLRSLPRTLDETYERILCSIDKDWIEEVRRILTLLCFSSRPLTVEELIDGVAVDLHEPAYLNLRRRLHDADDFHRLCPGLVDVGVKVNYETQVDSDRNNSIERTVPILRIAHFSVQEYLESGRIRQQKAAPFALESALAHAEIAQICLVYLLEPGLSSGILDQTKLMEYPMAHFAALFWYHHYNNATTGMLRLDYLISRLLQQRQGSFYTWVRLHNPDPSSAVRSDFSLSLSRFPSPVYYASLLGLDGVLHELIKIPQEHFNNRRTLVNARGGRYDSAPKAAPIKSHDKEVQIPVDTGASVNARDGRYGNALQAASAEGCEKVAHVLMNGRADVNVQGGYYSNALVAASIRGHEKVVQILIDAGADVYAQDGHYGNALQVASIRGYKKMMQMLIDAGIDVNAQGGYYGNALQAASLGGHEEVMQMLIDTGADISAQGGHYGNALQAASLGGQKELVQMLMNAGADVNAQGGHYGNALQAASLRGHKELVQMLMDAGADVNAQGGCHGNALQAASLEGHEKVVQMLMDAGADVNAHGIHYGNALQAASLGGHKELVQMLMNAGADVNAQGEYHGNSPQETREAV